MISAMLLPSCSENVFNQVPQLVLLGFEVFDIVLFRFHFNRHPFHHIQAVRFEPDDFPGIVAHDSDFPQPEGA